MIRGLPARVLLTGGALLLLAESARAAPPAPPAPASPAPALRPVAGSARAAPPALHAPAAVLTLPGLGVTILGRRADEQRPIASTTKLMTAYVVLHRARLDLLLTVAAYAAAPGESVAGLRPGERLTVADLLTAMLLPSGGDAAYTLAVDLAGSTGRFVGWMNAAAAGLGLRETHYATEVGLDTPGNHSSAGDLARLAAADMADPFLARTVAKQRAVLADGRTLVNRNDLLGGHAFVVGVKTGQTPAAGFCLVGAGLRRGVMVISVVLGEPSTQARDADTLALLRYGLSLYHRVRLVRRGHIYARIPVDGRPSEHVALVAARSVSLVVRAGSRPTLHLSHLAAAARGPLPGKTVLGSLTVALGGRRLARVALVNRFPLAPPPGGSGLRRGSPLVV